MTCLSNPHGTLTKGQQVVKADPVNLAWVPGVVDEVGEYQTNISFKDGSKAEIRRWNNRCTERIVAQDDPLLASAQKIAEASLLIKALARNTTKLMRNPKLVEAILALRQHVAQEDVDVTLKMLRACGAGGNIVLETERFLDKLEEGK